MQTRFHGLLVEFEGNPKRMGKVNYGYYPKKYSYRDYLRLGLGGEWWEGAEKYQI